MCDRVTIDFGLLLILLLISLSSKCEFFDTQNSTQNETALFGLYSHLSKYKF